MGGVRIKAQLNIDGTLTCRVCRVEKTLDNYHRNRRNSLGYDSICKPCAAAKARLWRQDHKQNRTIADNERAATRRAKRILGEDYWTDLEVGWRERLMDYFGRVCLRCGTDHPVEVDHIISLSGGGTHTRNNLQTLCKSCNSGKWTASVDYRNGRIFPG